MCDYKVVGDRPCVLCPLYGRKRHATDFVSTHGEFRHATTDHDPETTVPVFRGKYFYGKRGLAHRTTVAQKRLLYGEAIFFSEHGAR